MLIKANKLFVDFEGSELVNCVDKGCLRLTVRHLSINFKESSRGVGPL